MSEVEKMYKNAGVKLKKVCTHVDCDCDEMLCDECEYFKDNIFAFTAEKQLELIKWLGIRDEFNFYQNKVTKDWIFYDHEKDATHYDFELGLASWVNYLWQDLTSAEQNEIREILK